MMFEELRTEEHRDSVYFVRDGRSDVIKIGKSTRPKKRVADLQTGNPEPLELMGWILATDALRLEADLHRKYAAFRENGEWFALDLGSLLAELKSAGVDGFVTVGDSMYEVAAGRDGVRELLSSCNWADFAITEVCPSCGSFCGMHEVAHAYECRNCGAFTDFDEGEEQQEA